MRKIFTTRFNAYQNVVGVLTEFRPSYEEVPILVKYSDEFLSMFENLKSSITKAGLEYKEVTGKKATAKENLAKVASALASAGIVYAIDSDNAHLQSYLKFSYSDIRYGRDAEIIEICRNIAEEIESHKEALADYMIFDEQLAELKTLISEFEDLQIQTETVYSKNAIETRRVETLFKQIHHLVKRKLDRLVKNRKLMDPEFYNQYFQARRITDV